MHLVCKGHMSVQCEIAVKSRSRSADEHFRALSDRLGISLYRGRNRRSDNSPRHCFQTIGRMEIAQVNLPVGLLIWVMIIPMLVKVDFGALARGKATCARHRRDPVRELAGQAFYHGISWLAVYAQSVCTNGCPQTRSTATLPA